MSYEETQELATAVIELCEGNPAYHANVALALSRHLVEIEARRQLEPTLTLMTLFQMAEKDRP